MLKCHIRHLRRLFASRVRYQKCLFVYSIAFTLVSLFYFSSYLSKRLTFRTEPPEPLFCCDLKNERPFYRNHDHENDARLRINANVLVFVETEYSKRGRDILEFLVHNRINYKTAVTGKSLPVLTNLDKGKYGVIVFENYYKYLNMDKWNRELLDKYCRQYSVGIIGFVHPPDETLVGSQLKGFPLFIHTNVKLKNAYVNPDSNILRTTRPGEVFYEKLPGNDWVIFKGNHSTYESLELAFMYNEDTTQEEENQHVQTVIADHGRYDQIKRVLFGSGLNFWLHKLLFLDSLSYLSHGQLSKSLDRYVSIDIDDIFVSERGTRILQSDVRALIKAQEMIQSFVPNFKFNLGYCGKYFRHGNSDENLGDDTILQNIDKFNWFSHMWNHIQPHLYDNLSVLENDMLLNKKFAIEKGIPTTSGYSISPHHSGVYPVHEILYSAWKNVWNVSVTSTEEYPHLRPARLRRGFVHQKIKVLPRQTCGLFTHTIKINRYPGGRMKLDDSIQGGELFQTLVFNPINIFMTHMTNYGGDRLALYTFLSVFKFLKCWTNLKLHYENPIRLSEIYFTQFPEETDPIWGNPCNDAKHRRIWSKSKTCKSLPKFVIIGPQKTGTTALYTFLSLHPSLIPSLASEDTFEEIQFFNGKKYYEGIDWYMRFFPAHENVTIKQFYEKSATYFDSELVPKRAHALLPDAKIISILISPVKRAYSWYQHMKDHKDFAATHYDFYQVITANDSSPKVLKKLRNRCLFPGKYAQYIEKWLIHYPLQQFIIINGEDLKINPISVLNELQKTLKLGPFIDYNTLLRYDERKGYFCRIIHQNVTKCLGKSKGRKYEPMDQRSEHFLRRYYLSHNTALLKLFKRIGFKNIPRWLISELSDNFLP